MLPFGMVPAKLRNNNHTPKPPKISTKTDINSHLFTARPGWLRLVFLVPEPMITDLLTGAFAMRTCLFPDFAADRVDLVAFVDFIGFALLAGFFVTCLVITIPLKDITLMLALNVP